MLIGPATPRWSGVALCLWCAALADGADSQPREPVAATTGAPSAYRWYWDPIHDLVADTLDDAWRIAAAPTQWDAGDWGCAGLAAGAVIGSIAFLDEPVQRYSQRHRSRWSDRIATDANPFGTVYSFGVLGSFGLIGWTADEQPAKDVLVDGLEATVIASGVVTPTLKFAAGRSRPNADEGAHRFRPFSHAASFPSGHTTQAFAVASVVATVYDDHAWVAPIAMAGAGLVGFARINDNKHFLSDVLVGGMIGAGVGYEVVHLDRERGQNRKVTVMPMINAAGRGVAIAWRF